MKSIYKFKCVKFKFHFEERRRKKPELEEKVIKRTVDLHDQQKRGKESGEKEDEARQKDSQRFLEEEQRNISRKLTDIL